MVRLLMERKFININLYFEDFSFVIRCIGVFFVLRWHVYMGRLLCLRRTKE
jgi:hypothetical protein